MSDLINEEKRLKAVMSELKQKLENAQKRLIELQKESPRLMATYFLNELTNGEIDDHKSKISELKTFIEDAGSGLEGLDILAADCKKSLEKESSEDAKRQAEVRYEDLRCRVSVLGSPQTYDRWVESSFRQAAAHVGRQTEANVILRDLQKKRDNQPRV